MVCIKCGHSLCSDSKFCSNCGNQVDLKAEVMTEEKEVIKSNMNSIEQYDFLSGKMFGYLHYLWIESHIEIKDNVLTIRTQKRYFPCFKCKPKCYDIPIKDIKEAVVKNSIDRFDLIFAILFIFVGFFNPVSFIGTALFLYTGFCKNIIITLKTGAVVKIASQYDDNAKSFMNRVQELRNA